MELSNLSLTQARKGLLEKKFSCGEYTDALLARMRDHADVNAWAWLDEEGLRARARQLDESGAARDAALQLAGMPVGVKDNIDVAGMPGTAGTVALQGRVPQASAGIVDALTQQGALIAGKTGMHELAMGVTSNNALTGPVRNPYDLSRFAGGSSGGSAAAVAAGFVPCALGTETGGSIRMPSALCGIAGFRPTQGRYASTGLIPLSKTRDAGGPMARTVQDLALLDAVLSGDPAPAAPVDFKQLRLGVPRDSLLADMNPDVARVLDEVLGLLARQGATLIDADIPRFLELDAAIGYPLVLYEFERDLPAYVTSTWKSMTLAEIIAVIKSPDVAKSAQRQLGEGAVSRQAYEQAWSLRSEMQALCSEYFRGLRLDALVFPTAVLPAATIAEDIQVQHNGRKVSTFEIFSRNCNPGSVAGLPGLNVPAGLAGELPVGLCLNGSWHSDKWLLALGEAIQALLPPMPPPRFIPA